MTKIITLTANPAIDISTKLGKIEPFTKLRCAPARRHPGGGGINVARAVKRLGGEVAAIYPAGGIAGALLRRLVDEEGVQSLVVAAREDTRENFTVFEESTGRQYRFVLPGAPLSEAEADACLARLASADPAPDFLVASGSLPPGLPEDFFARAADIAKARGAKVVVDSSGAALTAALARGVYLIKPNMREFRELTGETSREDAALVQAARKLMAAGRVELIALTRGPGGALLIGRDRVFRAEGLPIEAVSVVGAGDSFTGAMVLALTQNKSPEEALRYAVAAGSAALLSPGTELCRPQDVARLLPQVVVREAACPALGKESSCDA